MESRHLNPEKNQTIRDWIIVLAIALLLAFWGLFIYFTVGEKGPHPWDFGIVEDIPGESPYSTYQPGQVSGSAAPEEQHVSGRTKGTSDSEKEENP